MLELEFNMAALILIYCNVIGWGVAFCLERTDVKMQAGFMKVVGHIIIDCALLITVMLFIPGATHLLYVTTAATMMLLNPFFLVTADPNVPLKHLKLTKLYIKKMYIMFLITALVTIQYSIRDISLYWPLAVIQLMCGINLIVSNPAGLIRRQQKELTQVKIRAPRYDEIHHL